MPALVILTPARAGLLPARFVGFVVMAPLFALPLLFLSSLSERRETTKRPCPRPDADSPWSTSSSLSRPSPAPAASA